MANTPKSNRLKRKRGKKFVYRDNAAAGKDAVAPQENPFEMHSKVQKFNRDLEKREQLLKEYRQLGKNGAIVDNRIAEKSSKLSEDDKMRLRYIAEQRERASMHLTTNKKKQKFNLDSDDDDQQEVQIGFTHKGRPLTLDDDFNEKIDNDSDDELADKGKLTEDMVNRMNFGRGYDEEDTQQPSEKQKTRKEIFQEIIEKSKAYKEANQELKEINKDLVKELDDDYSNLVGLLNFNRNKTRGPDESKDPKIQKSDLKGKEYDKAKFELMENMGPKAVPVTKAATEHDKALQRRQQIETELNTKANAETPERKRDEKAKDKRDYAIEKALKQQAEDGKAEKKTAQAGQSVLQSLKKATFDDDLQSEEEASDSYDDEEEGEWSDEDESESN